MISYNDPIVEQNPDPVALDLAVQSIQGKFAESLPWLQKIFGLATYQSRKVTKKEQEDGTKGDVIYPEVYNQREPMSLIVNDNLDSYCFFFASDPLKFIDYELFTKDTPATQPISIYTWVNLDRIDNTKNYNFADSLRLEMVRVLKLCPSFKLDQSYNQWNNVFKPFTITEGFRQFMKPPYAAWRLDGTIAFDFSVCL